MNNQTYIVSFWKVNFRKDMVKKEIVSANMEKALKLAKQLQGNADNYSWLIYAKHPDPLHPENRKN